jgi:hypothetical protein
MPEKPLRTLKLVKKFVFCHQAIMGPAEAAGDLGDLFNARRDVKPIEDMLGVRMQEGG